jgi:hypothetical protein
VPERPEAPTGSALGVVQERHPGPTHEARLFFELAAFMGLLAGKGVPPCGSIKLFDWAMCRVFFWVSKRIRANIDYNLTREFPTNSH